MNLNDRRVLLTGATYYSRVIPGIAPVNAPRYALPIGAILILTLAPVLRFDQPDPLGQALRRPANA